MDVAIRDGRIVAVGDMEVGVIGQTIDCAGRVISPGFIDLHSHSDEPIVDPDTRANVNYLTQGCTTVVTGNCGGGRVDVAEYFEQIDSAGAGTNVIHLIPHGSLRSQVFGIARRTPSADELAQMKSLADQGMREGAWGMSTGLIYAPGTYAETDELVEVASVVGRHGGIYASHIRSENTGLIDAVREAIEIGRRAELPVHVSHIKASGKSAWGGLRVAASIIEEARNEGLVVTADQYPYIASSTSLEAMMIPSWAREGGSKALIERFDDEEIGSKLRNEMADERETRNRIVIATFRKRPDWVGKDLETIAEAEGISVVEVVERIVRAGGAAAISYGMNEDEVRLAMQLPWVATASDGSSKIPSADRPHPRSFGTFARKIGHYASRENVITLAAAIRSCSGLPADILGLKDRGYVRVGYVADLAVFDPKALIDNATFDDPYRYSTGMEYVFVSGKPAIYHASPTGLLAGIALRHKSTVSGLGALMDHVERHPQGDAPYSFSKEAYKDDLKSLPIGVFDSGIGGLTVLEAILSLDAFDNSNLRPGGDGIPDFEKERFIYLGDQANMPYGNYAAYGKQDYLRELILKDSLFLLGKRYWESPTAKTPRLDKAPVKAVVIACNTATAFGLDDVRRAFEAWNVPVFVVGVVEAGARGVNEMIRFEDTPPTVAILATVGTCNSMAYPKAIGSATGIAGKRLPRVIQHGSASLAAAIEGDPATVSSGEDSRGDVIAEYVRQDVTALVESYRDSGAEQPIEMVVLGCTHFPLVQDEILGAFARLRKEVRESDGSRPYQSLVAEELTIINPAELVAKELFRLLAASRLRITGDKRSVLERDLFYHSVASPDIDASLRTPAGDLTTEYKYGRQVGRLDQEDSRIVPLTGDMLPASSRQLMKDRLPLTWKRMSH